METSNEASTIERRGAYINGGTDLRFVPFKEIIQTPLNATKLRSVAHLSKVESSFKVSVF